MGHVICKKNPALLVSYPWVPFFIPKTEDGRETIRQPNRRLAGGGGDARRCGEMPAAPAAVGQRGEVELRERQDTERARHGGDERIHGGRGPVLRG